MKTVRILFVCMGNICRSPTAEGMMRALVAKRGLQDRILLDSAGTHGYHVGKPADRRAIQAAAARDIDLSDLRSRCFHVADFECFDLLLAADRHNLENMESLRPDGNVTPLRLIMDYLPAGSPLAVVDEVPDPYYGGQSGFERVLDLLEHACNGLLDAWESGEIPASTVESATRSGAG